MTATEPDGYLATTIDWGAALAEHGRWLRTVVRARVGEPQAVDEVMQEVSLAAVAARPGPSGPEKVAPWLYRTAVRQSLLHRRRLGRHRRLVERFARVGGVGPAPDPLAWLVDDERRGRVREAVARLPRRDAELILLKYTEDWSYRDLAARLGTTESAVESRLHRVRRRLRDELAAERNAID